MTKQKKILNDLAIKHNITISQAEEIWSLFCEKIKEVICEPDKKINNQYDVTKFKTIHIHNFGKFKPNAKKVHYANVGLKNREK